MAAEPVTLIQGALQAMQELQRVLERAGFRALVFGPPGCDANA